MIVKPSQVSEALRRIAAKIDNSKNPRADLVARELKRVVAAVASAPDQKILNDLRNALDEFRVHGVGEPSPVQVTPDTQVYWYEEFSPMYPEGDGVIRLILAADGDDRAIYEAPSIDEVDIVEATEAVSKALLQIEAEKQ